MYILLVDRACWMGTSHHLSSSTNNQEGRSSASYEEIFETLYYHVVFFWAVTFLNIISSNAVTPGSDKISMTSFPVLDNEMGTPPHSSMQGIHHSPHEEPATQELERHLEGIMFCCLPSTDKVFLNFLLFKTTVSVLRALFSIFKEMTLSVCK